MSLHNPRRKHSIVIPALLGLVVAAELSIFAWQVDVHYILTFFLATKAGFSRMDADAIAMGNQSVDDAYDAAPTAMIWVLLRGDMTAARAVQEKHFPSDGPFPSPPQRRFVTPNGPMARWPIESLIHPNPASTALINFGRQMHPFHDSWSHQGVPDVPLRPGIQLRPNLSSAHPESRGGWLSSDADLTYKHVEEVVHLARETYMLMRRYLDQNHNLRSHPEVRWEDLEPVVRDFAKAKTRQEKNDWAGKNIPMVDEVRRQVISTLTLPGVSPRQDVRTFWALRPPPGSRTAAAVPSGLVETVNKFVTAWIRNQDVDQA